MKILHTLTPVKRSEPSDIRGLFHPDSYQHPGRMRYSVADEAIVWAHQWLKMKGICLRALADPMMGRGTVPIAALRREIIPLGMDVDVDALLWTREAAGALGVHPDNFKCANSSSPLINAFLDTWPFFQVLFTSPPFANAHSQGEGEMQEALEEQKSTYAGNSMALDDVWGCTASGERRMKKWILALYEVLRHWVARMQKNNLVMIHNKDFAENGKLVDTGEWTAEVFDYLDLDLLGHIIVPLAYTSAFQEWQKGHRRWILDWVNPRSVRLSCGHVKTYEKTPKARPEKAVCLHPDCFREDYVEISQERIIVGRLR